MLLRSARILLLFHGLAIASLASDASSTRTITILYANDFHAAVEPMKATWLVDQPMLGGVRAFAGWVDMFRHNEPNTFLFDSGDLYTGQAISTITRGKALVEMYRSIGFDAVCYGNHEFDYGMGSAKNYSETEPFPVLSANLFYKGTNRPFTKQFAIIEKYGIKIAVIGVFGVDAASATLQTTWDVLDVRDPIPILQALVPELRKKADLVVVVAHQGETGPMQADAEAHPEVQRNFDADKKMVDTVPGIDVFIGGHAHRGIEVPWVSQRTGTIVVQTYGRGTTVGFLQLRLDTLRHRILSHHGSLIRTVPDVFPVPQVVEETVEHWEVEADKAGKEVLGVSEIPLVRNYNGESTLGDLVTDAMLWKSGAQMAFVNAGGFRGDLAQGPITRYDVISALPFMNTSVEMELKGSEIRSALEQSLTLKTGMLQLAGLRVSYDLNAPEYHRLVEVSVGGKPLDNAATYKIAASSFIAAGGDHYDAFLGGANIRDTGILLSDVLAQYLKEKRTIRAPMERRLSSK